ncbi:amidase family protein [Corynebacterium lactis]|uniref:amidase n=1 Tax=Corynebacterium lactis RW2-5 TaxID=1408189 RepID=A0A0K2H221_9CORY|nr:amidase family protein [Corynebacterium lactis]ALA68092.1 amidase [Corynebacterium lactis RW2-5]
MTSHTSAIRDLPTVHEIAAQVREGKLSPVDSVQRSLDAISRLDGGVHAFREVWAGRALQAARDLEQREDLSQLPLAGVPFSLKENTVPENPFVRQLTNAGAIAVGTTVNPQFCTWGTTTLPGLTVDNPTLPGHTPGGSSGGSAAAVAAGMVPFAQGNDGMGSLRIPAACCGLSTLKSTPGIMPGRVGGTDWFGMSVHGVLTVNNEDLCLITKVLTDGLVDAENPAKTLPENFAVSLDTTAPVFGLKAAPEYVDAAQQAAKVFADNGFVVTEKKMPYPLNPLPMLARWTAGVADQLRYGPRPDHLEWRNRIHARIGRSLRFIINDRQVVRDRARIERELPGDTILITPALAKTPPRNRAWHRMPWIVNLLSNLRFTPYASTWNYLGFPAGIVVEPVSGLPVQLIARPTQERILLTAMETIASGGRIV